jgi:AraC-like DNA-binding protein
MRQLLRLMILISLAGCQTDLTENIIIDDFEAGNYAKWINQGVSFQKVHKFGNDSNNIACSKYTSSTFAQGKLSRKIEIKRNYIKFLIAGGEHSQREKISLIINNKEVKTTTGQDDLILRETYWDVSQYKGMDAKIEIVDAIDNYREKIEAEYTYIIVDDIIQTDYHNNDYKLIDNFETESYGNWKIEGESFSKPTDLEKVYFPLTVTHFNGKKVAASFGKHLDYTKGKLISKEFKINHKFLNFKICGGNHPKYTCLNLIIEDSIVYSATGKNNSELKKHTWNIEKYIGKIGRIEIVDNIADEWGHIIVDNIYFSNNYSGLNKKKNALIILCIIIIIIIFTYIYNTNRHIICSKSNSKFYEIENWIKEDDKYLDIHFKAKHIINRFNIPFEQLDKLFKVNTGKTLKKYINSIRIKKLIHEMTKVENHNIKIEIIGEKCGFNSRSSLYRIFKQETGQTPSEYINEFIK